MAGDGYRDYFKVLGVERGADADTIKRAFRRLARQYHPDMNKNNASATEKFKEVQEAYDVLSDETKRANYDQFGHAGVGAAGPGERHDLESRAHRWNVLVDDREQPFLDDTLDLGGGLAFAVGDV